jgi:nickel/cobalt transporter (NiCoT) family protein
VEDGCEFDVMISALFNDASSRLRSKIAGIGVLLVGFNLIAWAWAFFAFRDHPLLMGSALLAYSFGLRHAVDADHIAAIDNVTRKLMQEGKQPVSVGLFFSLGHSTVVVALSLLVAVATTSIQSRFADFQALGGPIGTGVSAGFLFAIAASNLFVMRGIWRAFGKARRGEPLVEEDLNVMLNQRGFFGRLFRRLFQLINRSWHMFPLGLLFGLGFDTATEVGLLGISAESASHALSPWSILVFPALFSAGMALADTADGILMLGAYGWAFIKPVRKLYYNLTTTLVSVVVAVFVGGVETLGLLADQFKFEGAFWSFIDRINMNFGLLGYAIICVFIVAWLASVLIYRIKRFDTIGPAL